MNISRRNLIKAAAILGAGYSVPAMGKQVDPYQKIARDIILRKLHENVFSEELILQSGLCMSNFVLNHVDGLGKFYRWKGWGKLCHEITKRIPLLE